MLCLLAVAVELDAVCAVACLWECETLRSSSESRRRPWQRSCGLRNVYHAALLQSSLEARKLFYAMVCVVCGTVSRSIEYESRARRAAPLPASSRLRWTINFTFDLAYIVTTLCWAYLRSTPEIRSLLVNRLYSWTGFPPECRGTAGKFFTDRKDYNNMV